MAIPGDGPAAVPDGKAAHQGRNGGNGSGLDVAYRPLSALDALEKIHDMPAGVGFERCLVVPRFVVQSHLFFFESAASRCLYASSLGQP